MALLELLADVGFEYCISVSLILVVVYLLSQLRGVVVAVGTTREHRLPPGPFALPWVGSIPFIGDMPHVAFMRWATTYGSVVGVQLGAERVVVLNDSDAVRDALVKQADVFDGRPQLYVFEKLNAGRGLFSREGKQWQEQRKFNIRCLRNLGMGKHNIEERTRIEARALVDIIRNQDGAAFDPHCHLTVAIANVICTMVFGERFEHGDAEFKYMFQLFEDSLRLAEFAGAVNFLPFLRHFPNLTKVDKLLENRRKEVEFINKRIDEHRATLDVDSPRDFIDAFLIEIERAKQQGTIDTTFTVEELRIAIMILFMASTETTQTTLRWGILHLMAKPDVQKRIQTEIDDVVGAGRFPALRDRNRMPYTSATIMEMQRCANVMPLAPLHATTRATTLHGYYIPERTSVMINLWAVHRDPRYWKQPEEFHPERFLDSDGNTFIPESFMPFGAGPRTCMGSGMAKNTLFLLLTSVLQHLTLREAAGRIQDGVAGDVTSAGSSAPRSRHEPSAELQKLLGQRSPGITSQPRPFVCCADPRGA